MVVVLLLVGEGAWLSLRGRSGDEDGEETACAVSGCWSRRPAELWSVASRSGEMVVVAKGASLRFLELDEAVVDCARPLQTEQPLESQKDGKGSAARRFR